MRSQASKKIFWVFIFFLVLIISAVSSFLLAKYLKTNKSVKSASVSITPVVTKSQEVNYKTYTNEIYGFSFKYPSTWQEQKSGAGSSNKELIFQVGFNNSSSAQDASQADKTDVSNLKKNIYLKIYEPKKQLTLLEWINKSYNSSNGFKLGSEIEMAGQKGYTVQNINPENYNYAYAVSEDNYIFEFGTNYQDSSKNDLLSELSKSFQLLP
ncbi:MAG: PsbP-related protein [Patescibacteria group bacterium]